MHGPVLKPPAWRQRSKDVRDSAGLTEQSGDWLPRNDWTMAVEAGGGTMKIGPRRELRRRFGAAVAALAILVQVATPVPKSLSTSASSATPAVWHVATTGNDLAGGSITRPLRTIQYAIDTASSGDTIIVLEGTYGGSGNADLDFRGKALTVRSRDPDDDTCMRDTIIDARGLGSIARFLHDEGPETLLEGFTLIAGDASTITRGIPGFFEFSTNARPRTRRLRVRGPAPAPFTLPAPSQDLSSGYSWDGMNPFHQPVATTDYYGSGDVDNDGEMTATDASLAQEISNGLRAANARADVDGSGWVNAEDVLLINNAVGGATLPAWWDDLLDRSERDRWVTRLMAIDQTDKHPYQYWFRCGQFASQTYYHTAFARRDMSCSFYDGEQTAFNVPMYMVHTFRHAINSILVGDNPLDFSAWRFIEPQTDNAVYPGAWNMPYGTHVRIAGIGTGMVVQFFVDESGWDLVDHNPSLILARPRPPTQTPDNRPTLQNPRILSAESGLLLYERTRDDLTRKTDIHLAPLSFAGPLGGSPLIQSAEYSRLLDVFQGTDGTIRLLWTGKPEYTPGVFYGHLIASTGVVTEVSRVSAGARTVFMGRVLATPEGETLVFWLEGREEDDDPYLPGIYWTRWAGSGWQAEQNLTPGMEESLHCNSNAQALDQREHRLSFFDVAASRNGGIVLVWNDSEENALRQMTYDGAWGSPGVVFDLPYGYLGELALEADATGVVHLVYWLVDYSGKSPTCRPHEVASPNCQGAPTIGWFGGNLFHQTYDGTSWSTPQAVDSVGSSGYPRMSAGGQGAVYLVWEAKTGDRVLPVWNQYMGGNWNIPRILNVRPNADAWYPTVQALSDGTIAFAWSSRTPDRMTIETHLASPLPPLQRSYLPDIRREG